MGGIVSGFFGEDPGAPPQVSVWQPGGLQQADTTYQNLTQRAAANNPYIANQPAYSQYLANSLNNPYAAGAQTAANQAGAAYGTIGNQALANSGAMSNAAQQMLGAGQQVWNTALDPQSALYQRTLQQLQDQTRASQAARGITNSGYGANLENEALSNFNIDWQNQQLNRQMAGLNAMGGATTGAGNAYGVANQLGASGAESLGSSGMVPYATSSSILGNMLNALNNYGSSVGGASNALDLSTAGALGQYLNLGASQSNEAAQTQIANWQNQMAYDQMQNQQLANMVNSGINFGASMLSGGMGGFNGATASNGLQSLGYTQPNASTDAQWNSFLKNHSFG